MTNRTFIGFTTPPTRRVVDAWRVQLFCRAIGETDPVHWDVQAARAAGHPACPAPPTFLKALETDHCASAILMEKLGIALRTVLHAAQNFEALTPVYVGDTIEISRRISDRYDRRGGALSFVIVETQYLRGGTSVGNSRQTIVARNPMPETPVGPTA